jgi:hypothetical protein
VDRAYSYNRASVNLKILFPILTISVENGFNLRYTSFNVSGKSFLYLIEA